MEEESSKKQNTPVDEAYLMSIMAGGAKKQEAELSTADQREEKSATKERTRQRKVLELSYGERFLAHHKMGRRGDKSIYIRQDYHERLTRIAQVIGEDKIPLYAYLDNILEHHFEQFEKAISDNFNEKFKPIF